MVFKLLEIKTDLAYETLPSCPAYLPLENLTLENDAKKHKNGHFKGKF